MLVSRIPPHPERNVSRHSGTRDPLREPADESRYFVASQRIAYLCVEGVEGFVHKCHFPLFGILALGAISSYIYIPALMREPRHLAGDFSRSH